MASEQYHSGHGHASSMAFIGIDVGTGSVRACLLSETGQTLASATSPITTWRYSDHRLFEQSTQDIWKAIRDCLSNFPKDSVKGIGFDATCSLAVVDFAGDEISVTKDSVGHPGGRNVILWADHRAESEANLINTIPSEALKYVGGTVSLEMETPKILWIKNNLNADNFDNLQFFLLPDYLTYRATASSTRSGCSLSCKCSYLPTQEWDPSFFKSMGLSSIVSNDFRQVGTPGDVSSAGFPIGSGLSAQSAEELQLPPGTPVGSPLIDAYAGWLGTISARPSPNSPPSSLTASKHRIAVIAGTSTCHIVQSPDPIFVKGIWGPYKNAILEGWWMNEGGQSSTGQLIEFVLTTHPAHKELLGLAEQKKSTPHDVLHALLEEMAEGSSVTELISSVFIYPDFHGNRSPLADPLMRGMAHGLMLDSSVSDLAKKYAATLEAIALQTRHIIEVLNAAGHEINQVYVSGGQVKNRYLMQLLADVTSLDVVLPGDVDGSVVRGSAILGRFAYEISNGNKEDPAELLWKIMVEMTPPGTLLSPKASGKEKKILEAKYKMFLDSIEVQKRWRTWMDEATV